jgi:hypothetical protein
MWEEAYPQATVIGIDWNLANCVYEPKRGKLYQIDARSETALREVVDRHGPFDLVIDDAAHTPECTNAITKVVWPGAIVKGGFFVIEDVHVNGMQGVAKSWVDAVNHHGALRSCGRQNWTEPGHTDFDKEIDGVLYVPGIVAIRRFAG